MLQHNCKSTGVLIKLCEIKWKLHLLISNTQSTCSKVISVRNMHLEKSTKGPSKLTSNDKGLTLLTPPFCFRASTCIVFWLESSVKPALCRLPDTSNIWTLLGHKGIYKVPTIATFHGAYIIELWYTCPYTPTNTHRDIHWQKKKIRLQRYFQRDRRFTYKRIIYLQTGSCYLLTFCFIFWNKT